jgi:Uncharacterized protein conserved in bacteria (DUF2213)
MPKYHALILSPNISKTAEGYLVCQNVPLCRSGFQEYKGSELVGFDGYEDGWGLNSEQLYRVYRPKTEVLHPDFIASLEGKTVVDEHPDGNVVHIDNDGEVNCGHVERVGEGKPLEDGEVTLKGDLIIKNPELVEKVRPDHDPDNRYGTAVRDVSLGYGLKLRRTESGRLEMYQLRGNHVAVVGKGRAGPRIAIKDSAPPEIKSNKEKPMSKLLEVIFGRGLKASGVDVGSEDAATIVKELLETDNPKPILVPVIADTAVTGIHHKACHACLDRAIEARGKSDHMGVDAFGKPSHLDDIKKELMKYLDHEETPKAGDSLEEMVGDEELEQKEKTPAEESDKTKATDMEHAEPQDPAFEPGDSVLKAANDSVKNFIRSSRPIVSVISIKPKKDRSQMEQTMLDSYNSAVKSINSVGGKAYQVLSQSKIPAGIPAAASIAADAAVTKIEEACNCFDGVPYRVGLKKHEAHLAHKENK